jgi:hypothetical protein
VAAGTQEQLSPEARGEQRGAIAGGLPSATGVSQPIVSEADEPAALGGLGCQFAHVDLPSAESEELNIINTDDSQILAAWQECFCEAQAIRPLV